MAVRFAITATDRWLGVFEALVEAGWEPLKLFTTATDDRVHRNRAVIDYATRLGIDVRFSRIGDEDLRDLGRRGCDALVVASYRWRIPDWRPHLKYAVNFHPSPLPEERGPYPLVHAVLQDRRAWAVTCHKLDEAFDTGDILDAERFPIDAGECHERLDLKTQMAARRLAARVAGNLPALWDAAVAQGEGTNSGHWTATERQLDFARPVDEILRKLRAFGAIETTAKVNDVDFFVRRAVGWQEAHAQRPGSVVLISGLTMVVAAADGYIGIVEWSLLDPDATVGRIGRQA